MKKVNYGLIGCGMMGHEHIRNIGLLPGARIVVVFDPMAELAEAAAQEAGGAVIASTLADLLAHPDLDALVIVSPNYFHVPQLTEIAATRPLPVLVEKPLYTDPSQAAWAADFAKTYPAPVWVAMEYRYMPPIAALLSEAQATTGGVRMLTIREHRFPFLRKVGDWNRFNANTGGTLVEKCCHFFDLMRLVMQSDPVRVMASGGQAVNHKDEVYDGKPSDVWDHAYVIVDFANGSKAMLELCMFAEGSRYQEEVCAVGPLGKIEALVPGPGRFWPPHLGEPPEAQLILSPRHPKGEVVREIAVDPALLAAGDHNGATFYQHQAFNAVVRGDGLPQVSVTDGAWAVRIGLAAQESARSGQSVTL